MTILGAVARSALPDVHQLLRFALIVLVTVAVWLAARAVLRASSSTPRPTGAAAGSRSAMPRAGRRRVPGHRLRGNGGSRSGGGAAAASCRSPVSRGVRVRPLRGVLAQEAVDRVAQSAIAWSVSGSEPCSYAPMAMRSFLSLYAAMSDRTRWPAVCISGVSTSDVRRETDCSTSMAG